MTRTNLTLDLAIVGAGPCGLAVAVAAKERGLRFAILDRGAITESLTRYPHYMTFFSTAELLEIGGVPFTIPEAKPTRREALAYYRHAVAHHGVAVRQYEEVTRIDRRAEAEVANKGGPRCRSVGDRGDFIVHARDRDGRKDRVRARAVAVATGGFGEPNRLELPGGEPEGRVVHYYREPFPFFDQDVIVVGGGNSAVEAALELHRSGVRVRMVHFADVLDRGVKPWVRPDIDNRIEQGEIVMHWKSRIAALGPRTATIARDDTGAATDVANDWVLAMTGWRPDHELLSGLGVRIDPRTGIPDHHPATMETNVPGAYVAGVVAAGFDANRIFIENGREHGGLIAAALAGPIR
ncbi:MAG: YpdA family putative bacillithiol disulfide reductase [Gemmatimonadetes bacterium]|nr:YpdA family putative bacillithiol disulfide reductase [Gemmatimonadota bacterium]